MSSFRRDLDLAANWADNYLRRVGELPVAAQIQPGEVRARLPEAPPEQPESFEAMLRDLDELILPGLTHWNHPRFFAWIANTGSEPGVLAELLVAAMNVNAMTWVSSPAATELELTVLDWLAQLLGLPRGWHGHIEDTASTSMVAALAAARTVKPGGVVYASEQANFSVERAANLVGLEFRKVEVDDDKPAQHAQKLGRPEGGISAATRELGIQRDDARRSIAVAFSVAAVQWWCGCRWTALPFQAA